MSQSDTFRMYVGHDQVDVATLVADGITYRCYVYLDRTQWTIESLCMRVQPDGTEVQVFAITVAAATAAALAATSGLPMDSPKIVASGTVFVVHYLYADSVNGSGDRLWELTRATMDMTAFTDAWTDQLSTAIFTDALYDVCNVVGSTDFVVARKISATEVRVGRYDDLGWGDTAWIIDYSLAIATAVLGIYGHHVDNDVILAYQATGGSANRLFCMRIEGDSGNDSAPVQTFTDYPVANFLQVTLRRIGTQRVAVVAEVQSLSNASATGSSLPNFAHIHSLVFRAIDSSDATLVGNEHRADNLYLCSRAWTYASGNSNGVTSDLYVLAAFRGIDEPYEWQQAYLYALNLDVSLWSDVEGTASTEFNAPKLHPRAIATMWTDGIPDARSSGWQAGVAGAQHVGGPTKRKNHLSHAVPGIGTGPDCKTVAIATVVFSRLGDVAAIDPMVSPNEVATKEPERAGLCRRLIYMEDPQSVWRDTTSDEQPVDNFSGVNPRSMFQTLVAGKGMVVGGGTPQIYDGARIVELGFLWKPEIFAYVFGVGGSLIDNGVYIWYAVYSWTDAAGQTHRSGTVIRPAVALGVGNTAAQLYVRTMTISAKDHTAHYPGAAPIQIELYRTLSGGLDFYRVFGAAEGVNFQPRHTPTNDPTAEWITITDDVSDAQLVDQGIGPYAFDAAGEFLIEPIPVTPPAMSVVASYANRVWGADANDPSLVWYSDEILPDLGSVFYLAPVFGGSQFFRVGEIGEITAMHAMNDTLIVFTSGAIYSIKAADAGFGLLQCSFETLHTRTGCIEPRSVVEGPDGLYFQAAKGVFLLSRARSLDYLATGAAVEDEIRLAGNIRRATIHLDRSQLRLACNGRPAEIQTWTFTVSAAPEAGVWTITGLAVPISITVGAGLTQAEVGALIEAEIDANADALQFQVDTVSSPGATVVIGLLEDVALTLVGDGPGASTLTGVVAETIRCRPRTLIYDYHVKQWSRADLVRTNSLSTRLEEVVDAAAWGGLGDSDAHAVLLQGALLVERGPTDPLLYFDEASGGTRGIPIDVLTSWIHLAGVAGYKRVRSIGVQTIRVNDEAIAVTVEYDRDGDYDGQAPTLLPDTYEWASPAPAYLRIRPRVQKVAAVRLRIFEASAVGAVVSGGENLRIVALTFEVGSKPGLRRVRDAQIGTPNG